MNIIVNAANKRIILELTDEEWSTAKYMNKIYGSDFLKTFLEKFWNQRKEQRKDLRRQKMLDRFNVLTPAEQADILSRMSLVFDDE